MGQSFRGGPHILLSSLFFINHNLCVGSGVRTFSAPFCAYASFINETPAVFVTYKIAFSLPLTCLGYFNFLQRSCLNKEVDASDNPTMHLQEEYNINSNCGQCQVVVVP